MLRPGFFLGVSGPAAILTLLLLPAIRQEADAMTAPAMPRLGYETTATSLPGMRPYSTAISPIHLAAAPRPNSQIDTPARSAQEQMPVKTKRMTREGCEAPISSLAGPEARRMVPGRCMT